MASRVLFVALMLGSVGAKSKTCSKGMSVNDTCTADWQSIHPTQYTYGAQEVRQKTAKFSSMHSSDLEDYLKSNPIPCIQGLNGGLFAIDHHHLVRALSESDVSKDDKVVHVTIAGILDGYTSDDEFWKAMLTNNWVWLSDEKGNGPIHPSLLPSTVSSLVNDPYRSLAYNVRQAGGYNKLTIPYQDFLWGDFYRAHGLLPATKPSTGSHVAGQPWDFCQAAPASDLCLGGVAAEDKMLSEAQANAMALSTSPAASKLPGYISSATSDVAADDAENVDGGPAADPKPETRKESKVDSTLWVWIGVGSLCLMGVGAAATLLVQRLVQRQSVPDELVAAINAKADESTVVNCDRQPWAGGVQVARQKSLDCEPDGAKLKSATMIRRQASWAESEL